jgi:hypothetical protein
MEVLMVHCSEYNVEGWIDAYLCQELANIGMMSFCIQKELCRFTTLSPGSWSWETIFVRLHKWRFC